MKKIKPNVMKHLDMEKKSLTLCIEFGCDCNCVFCMLKGIISKLKAIEFNEYRSFLANEIKDEEYERLILSGAEVTMNKNLFKFIRFAKDSGHFKHIQVQTNGIKFSDKDYCRTIIAQGCDEFFITILSNSSTLHDKMTQNPGSFKKTVQGIKNILQMKKKVITNTVITRMNYTQLPDLTSLLSSIGIRIMHFWMYWPMESYDSNDMLISIRKVRPYLLKAMQKCINHNILPVVKYYPPCLLNHYSSFVSNCLSKTIIGQEYWNKFNKNRWDCLFFHKCIFNSKEERCYGLPLAYISKYGYDEDILKPI